MTISNSKQIRRAEVTLKKAGFEVGKIDGRSDGKLTKALKEFQGAWGLPVTGALDAATNEKLSHVADRIGNTKDYVGVGEKSSAIAKMERQLKTLGYDMGKADGTYTQETANAMRLFRKDQAELPQGLGGAGSMARAALNKETAALHHGAERRRVKVSDSPHAQKHLTDVAVRAPNADGTTGVKEGATGAAVANIQRHLAAAGFSPKHLNGQFDERTGAAVKAFQKASGLSVTGTVDAGTWNHLQKSILVSNKPAAPAQAVGERSKGVLHSEQLLKKMGFNTGKVDGLFDKKTMQAAKAFEKQNHLPVDGTIGTNELAKMEKVAKGDYRTKILDMARNQLGVHEGDNNRNKFSAFFGRGPEAWCADFVSYCYTKAGKPLNDPWTPGLLSKIKANGTYNRSNPKPGDIVLFDWVPGSGAPAMHTGLVEKVFMRGGQKFIQTIEGNTSSGDVARRTHQVSSNTVVGFGTMT
jgi:peptidoglycan hydrolase-like protein with peptidoglycan-binding domain